MVFDPLLQVDTFCAPVAVIPGIDPTEPAIVLTHNPDSLYATGWGDYRGWVLAGHTHGGQVRLPWIGSPQLPVEHKELVAGLYHLGDGRRVYISRGLGYIERVRFRVRPEITLFTLKRGAERST